MFEIDMAHVSIKLNFFGFLVLIAFSRIIDIATLQVTERLSTYFLTKDSLRFKYCIICRCNEAVNNHETIINNLVYKYSLIVLIKLHGMEMYKKFNVMSCTALRYIFHWFVVHAIKSVLYSDGRQLDICFLLEFQLQFKLCIELC